jgi:hypothetical protein
LDEGQGETGGVRAAGGVQGAVDCPPVEHAEHGDDQFDGEVCGDVVAYESESQAATHGAGEPVGHVGAQAL